MPDQLHTGESPSLYTRRDLFTKLPVAAVGAGVVAAAAAGAALSGCGSERNAPELDVLEVSDNSVITLDGYSEAEDIDKLHKIETVAELPAGSLVFSSDGKAAAVLMPGETASPLSILKIVNLETGEIGDGLKEPVGLAEGYNLYEVRMSASVCCWVESNYLTGDWRVYTAPVTDEVTTTTRHVRRYTATTDPETGETTYNSEELYFDEDHHHYKLGTPTMVDEGNADYDSPEIAVAGSQAYWIVEPNENGKAAEEDSLLKSQAGVVYTSHGRFCGGLSVNGDMLVALPRAESSTSVHYQMTALNGGTVTAQQVLPHSYRPNTFTYTSNGFAFGINGSYDYGDGIANVGTYIPLEDGNYLRLTRPPVTPPGYVKGWLYCKSGSRTVFVDIPGQRYFTVNAPSGTEQHGDFPVQQGACDALYTYATVNTTSEGKVSRKVVLRRISLGDFTNEGKREGEDEHTTIVDVDIEEGADEAMVTSQAERELGLLDE